MTAPRRAPLELYTAVNAIGAADVARALGMTPGKGGRGFYVCPVHGGDGTSFHATPRGGWKCFGGCNRGYSNVDLAAAVWGIDAGAACLELAELLGVPIPDRRDGHALARFRARRAPRRAPAAPAAPPVSDRERAQAAALEELRTAGVMPAEPPAVYAAALDALPWTDDAAVYFRDRRGLEPDAAEFYGFRTIAGGPAWCALYDALRDSFHPAELARAGLAAWSKAREAIDPNRGGPWRNDEAWGWGAWDRQPPALLVPYWHRGALVALRFRSLATNGPAADKANRYRTLGGANPAVPFNADALEQAAGAEIHVVEGEINAFALMLHGLRAVGIPGAGGWRDAWTPGLREASRVVAWYDLDKAGEQGRGNLAASLQAHHGGAWLRARGRTVRLPAGADANDLHRTGELHGIIAAAGWR